MHYLQITLLVSSLCLPVVIGSHADRLLAAREQKNAHLQRSHARSLPNVEHLQASASSPFLNAKSTKFVVNGTGLPLVPFDVGESYAGTLPISNASNEARELFFWFFPSTNPAAKNEIAVWLQGGPGASSLYGLLNENGPLLWQPGTYAPTQNPYSWNNLTNIVWIEQPVGVGFSGGKPDIKNEYELADQFKGFWKNFITTFGMQGYKIYLTGESYAGFYVPYIANSFLEANDKKYYNLSGISINDPTIGDEFLQFELPSIPYLDRFAGIFALNASFSNKLHNKYKSCGYADYLEKYFTFPAPNTHFPSIYPNYNFPPGCDVQSSIVAAASEINPCFNIEHIIDYCPDLYSPLGPINTNFVQPGTPQAYFNRADVKKALHVPVNTNWTVSATESVFVGKNLPYTIGYRDDTLPAAVTGVLQNVIEKTNNTIIGCGSLDFQLSTNGTLFVIQNLTWNGKQGFSQYPKNPLLTPYLTDYNPETLAGAGNLGVWHTERGLTFYEIVFAGHEIPQYQPGAAYRVLEKLLGRIPDLSSTVPFTG